MVRKRWLNQKLKNLKAKRKWLKNPMENKDIQVFVTGVSMAGESSLNEHDRAPEEDKVKSEGEEIGDSREDD